MTLQGQARQAVKEARERLDTRAQHTPGPWYTDAVDDDRYLITDGQDRIAAVRRIDVPPSIADANARLISAAPDLLEALEALFENCEMIHKYWGDGDNTKQADNAIAAARSAISKAKGE